MTDYALAAKKIELTRKQIDLIISLRWTVSPDPDLGFRQGCACPFCPGATARETEFERRFYLTPDWLEKPEDEDSKMMIQEVAGYFLAKELKSVGAEFVVSAARSALPKSDWRWVEAYRCSEHGEFLEVLDDDEGGFSVANPRMLIRR